MYKTSIDLPLQAREAMARLLNARLADAIDLALQVKQAHWNVKGPQFVSLHDLFDEVAEILEELTDELAERVVELGGIAEGTLQVVAGASRLVPYDRTVLAGMEHVKALGGAIVTFARSNRRAIDVAAAAGDATTADLFTEVSRAADKLLWKISAHVATSA